MPLDSGHGSALRRWMAARDQTRWVSRPGSDGGQRIKLFSRSGNELTNRFPLIVEAMAKLRSHSCIIDGEAMALRS
jgi:hypothetical protein